MNFVARADLTADLGAMNLILFPEISLVHRADDKLTMQCRSLLRDYLIRPTLCRERDRIESH